MREAIVRAKREAEEGKKREEGRETGKKTYKSESSRW
jgi:hypothetical protein